jgi:hypothetical protein
MAEMVKVVNRARYPRPYLVCKVDFPARTLVELDADQVMAMQANAPIFQQAVQKGLLVIQGTEDGKTKVFNSTDRSIVVRYPLVYLKPGENEVPAKLWQEVLKVYGDQVLVLQGQPDGLIF